MAQTKNTQYEVLTDLHLERGLAEDELRLIEANLDELFALALRRMSLEDDE